ncbi:L,D-transpeptidase family protein [Taibaiella chishuiensis]|uniref:L,D-transpeptidase-like protein n=1 Tax=Taibaiella chishuiensis TaxID=1434707 RepID=A0A2P8DCQ6_9BACT|nr:L,D-transpeptidase family protein [Taibaiella chishuiensis]PSK95000.1 L,D-transpeptidase-like protein [Taibaiella chishuiensis]
MTTNSKKPVHTRLVRSIALALIAAIGALLIYYVIPSAKIPDGVLVDRIVVYKAAHKLEAYAQGRLVVTYRVAIGKQPVGAKQYEGDQKTPEGIYTINDRNPNSGYHRNLGISYPNADDMARARQLGKPAGGDIKIHSLKNGQGYIGKFHRWKDWTNGCIALTDAEMDQLYEHTTLGATIEIRK